MEHVVTVTYTEEMVRKAAALYWRRGIGNSGLISLAAIFASCLVLWYLGSEAWLVGFFTGAGVIGAAIVIGSYFTIRNASLSVFGKMDDKTATFTFTETDVRIEADSGKSEMPWKRIDQVIQYPDFWLFSIAKSTYFTLPIATVPPETQEFILAHCPAEKSS